MKLPRRWHVRLKIQPDFAPGCCAAYHAGCPRMQRTRQSGLARCRLRIELQRQAKRSGAGVVTPTEQLGGVSGHQQRLARVQSSTNGLGLPSCQWAMRQVLRNSAESAGSCTFQAHKVARCNSKKFGSADRPDYGTSCKNKRSNGPYRP